MSIKKLLRPFRNKLFLESLLRSAVNAMIVAAIGVLITAVYYRFQRLLAPIPLAAAIGGGLFALTFAIAFLVRYPTIKKVATRVDGLGLQERVTTMLEYQHEDSQILRLQRKDAVEHIQKTEPKQMKITVKRKHWTVCLMSICLAIVMLVLPIRVLTDDELPEVPEISEEEQFIKDLIEQLRDQVQDSVLEEELKDQLDQILDDLENDLNQSDSDLEQAGQIQEAIKDMQNLLNQALSKNKIGEALQKYLLTRPLGEAISAADTEKVSTALSECAGLHHRVVRL